MLDCFRVLLVHVLSSILPSLLLPLLEGERVRSPQTGLYQKIHKVAT